MQADPVSNTGHDGWGPLLEPDGRVTFRLWAPSQTHLSLLIDGQVHAMVKRDGWFELTLADVKPGAEYGFSLADGRLLPDPASRRQAGALNGPSVVTASEDYGWKNEGWKGRPWQECVFYEIHIGTFTPEGTYLAASRKFAELAAIGFTAIEIMPIAHFPGQRGWGYDGVLHYAQHPPYGTPDDLKALVDAAHAEGLMVFLDVVYNHFGPQDNFLPTYAPEFYRPDKHTPWGQAIAFEQPAVRRYFLDNARYWLEEFRFDGLRLDAVDQIGDDSAVHLLTELATTIRRAFPDRLIHLVVENPASSPDLLRPRGRGRLYDADWNDDFHHSMHVAATGEDFGNYRSFAEGAWQNVAHTLAAGPVFVGRPPLRAEVSANDRWYPDAYIHFLQNHDQVGNRGFGERLWHLIDEHDVRLWTTLLLLSPEIPLMFMGDHYFSQTRFHFFADYAGELAEAVRGGRPGEARNFGAIEPRGTEADIPDPIAISTFLASKLDWSQAETREGRGWRKFVEALLSLRRAHIVPLIGGPCEAKIVVARDKVIAIDWVFGSGLIELRANFSEEPLIDAPVTGGIIHGANAVTNNTIAPRSIVVACSIR